MVKTVHDAIDSKRMQLANHPLYNAIQDVPTLTLFMQHHVYSVWDFMNLLKTLQAHCTCTTVPWRPAIDTDSARLINEIVLEEESDIIDGKATSHFMYYVSALQALNPKSNIHIFLDSLNSPNILYKDIITQDCIPIAVQSFLTSTYTAIQSSILETAAAFAFGRETLVPVIFEPLLKLKGNDPTITQFVSYLERHIELDGDVHGNLSEQLVTHVCQTNNDWELVKQAAVKALDARIHLWDAIYKAIS